MIDGALLICHLFLANYERLSRAGDELQIPVCIRGKPLSCRQEIPLPGHESLDDKRAFIRSGYGQQNMRWTEINAQG